MIAWLGSSSILGTVQRTVLALVIVLGTLVPGPFLYLAEGAQTENPQSESAPTETGDAFFAGIVAEYSSTKITVSRTVRGQLESKSFRITPQTKFEGRVVSKVRVTVGYITDDNGDVATIIVVRGNVAPPKNKK